MNPTALVRILSDEGGAFEIGAVYPAGPERYGFRAVRSDEHGWLLLRPREIEVVQEARP